MTVVHYVKSCVHVWCVVLHFVCSMICKEVCVHMVSAVLCSVCWVMCKKVWMPVVGALLSLWVVWHGVCALFCIVCAV